jgi:hypothetical protein
LLENKVLGREYKKGLEQGMEKGFEKGLSHGEANMLRRLLRQQFKRIPRWADAQISKATTQQLEEWGSRVLRAKSLDEVFS